MNIEQRPIKDVKPYGKNPCEKTGRRCFGMEIDPVYCDVIVKRWEDFTGNKAERQDG